MSFNQRLRGKLRELAQFTPDAESTRRAIAAARATIVEASPNYPINHWRVIMLRPKFAISAAAVLIAIAAVALLALSDSSRNVAFAQVVGEVERAKTVQYVETRSDLPRAGEPAGPTEVTKVTIVGRSLERKEVVSATEGDPLPEGHTWTKPQVGIVLISDLARGKIVALDTNNKTFSEVKAFFGISPDDGKLSESKVKPAPEVDFYTRMREFPAEKAERLPPRELAGRQVIGFHTTETIERKQGVDTWTRTFWVDPKSSLPVQVEVTFESTSPRMGQSRWVQSDMVFDAPVDESLLSTDPPAGYTVRGE